jgi:hypothetical protein
LPKEIDRVVRKAWSSIYKGNITNASAIFTKFLDKYNTYVIKQVPFHVDDLTGEDMLEELRGAKNSVGSLDGWTNEDMAIISPYAAQALADMLNSIELGAPWPKVTKQARAAFLAKGVDTEDCLNYRILSILAVVYRRWASRRLKDLKPWIASWGMDEFFAGVGPNGAEDAWYTTSLQVELARLQDQEVTGATADVWKCFDQICRKFLYLILALGGCPDRIITAYENFHEGATYYNSLAGSLGEAHQHPNGIPQGCPLSMTFVAFWLRPWVMMVKERAGIPRLLADDILVMAIGHKHEQLFKDCYDLTHQFLQDVGAKIASSKCFAFSTHPTTRRRLRLHYWEYLHAFVPVVTHLRDLGSHLSSCTIPKGATITARLHKATGIATRIARTSFSYATTAKMIRMVALPTGLYGSEAAPVADQALGSFRAAIAKVIGPNSRLTNHTMKFNLCGIGNDLDPVVELLSRRVVILRRMIAKHAFVLPMVQQLLQLYTNINFLGTDVRQSTLCELLPAPPPGSGTKQRWKHTTQAMGPIGLLLLSLNENAVALSPDLAICSHLETPIPLTLLPFQYLKPAIQQVGIKARTRQAASARQAYCHIGLLDLDAYRSAVRKKTIDHQQWLLHTQCLGTWTDSRKEVISPTSDGCCDYCGCPNGDIIHLIWVCQAFALVRFLGDDQLKLIQHELMPDHFLLGIPGQLPAEYNHNLNDQVTTEESVLFHPPQHHPLAFDTPLADAGIQLLERYKEARRGMTAHQFIDSLRTSGDYGKLPTALPCLEAAPLLPNVWTDGTKTHPNHPAWSLAGYGCWFPDRDQQSAHPAERTQGLLVSTPLTQGKLAIAGGLAFNLSSSTRAEVAAGLVAIAAPLAVHIGTDSAAFKAKVDTILADPTAIPRRPWASQKDGDLWEAMALSISTKGANAVKVSWFKGHANDSHVASGSATSASRIHNDIADKVADEGVQHGIAEGIACLTDYYAAKQGAYIKLLTRVHDLVIRVLTEEKVAREALATQRRLLAGILPSSRARLKTLVPSKPPFHDPCEEELGFTLRVRQPSCLGLSPEQTVLQLHLWIFLRNSKWKVAPSSSNGCSWLELFARFQAVGGLLTETDLEESCLGPRKSLRHLLLLFRCHLMRFVDIHLEPDQASLFKPIKLKEHRLAMYGIHYHVPCIGAYLLLSDTGASTMHSQMLALIGHDQPLHHNLASQGLLWVIPAKVKMRGPPPWARHTDPTIIPTILLAKIRKQKILEQDYYTGGVQPAPTFFHLSCPRCTDTFNFASLSLVNKSKWTSVKCKSCRVTTKASTWQCACNSPWPMCTSHRDAGFSCKRPVARKRHPKKPSLQPTHGQLGDPHLPVGRPPCLSPPFKRAKLAESSTCNLPRVSTSVVQASAVHSPPTVFGQVKRKLRFTPGPQLAAKLLKMQPL